MFTAVSRHLQRQAGPRLCSRGNVMFLSQGVHPKTCEECSLWKAWLAHLTFQLLQEQEVTPRDEHSQIKGTVLALDWRMWNSEVWPYKLNNTEKAPWSIRRSIMKAWMVFLWETKSFNPVLLRAQILDSHTKQVCQLPKSSELYLWLWIVRGGPWNLPWNKLMYRQNWGHWPSFNEQKAYL